MWDEAGLVEYLTDPGAYLKAKLSDDAAKTKMTFKLAKGGEAEQTLGRKCLCNSLLANVTLAEPQVQGGPEPPLLTAGDDLDSLRLFLPPGEHDYGAAEVLAALARPAPS